LPCGVVILLGSKLPEVFKDSDADFNLGLALGFDAVFIRNAILVL